MYGWENTREHLKVLWAEHQRLSHHNTKDNERDEDGNGIADVDEASGKELFTRKLHLFLIHADPQRMNAAVGGLWHATLGVIGVLKIQFARTVTLGAAIGDVLSKTIGRYATPVLVHMLPEQCTLCRGGVEARSGAGVVSAFIGTHLACLRAVCASRAVGVLAAG